MRLTRILCLGIAVASFAVLLVGAGSASATGTAICDAQTFEFEEEGEAPVTSCAETSLYGVDVNAGDTLSGALTPDSPHGTGTGEMVFVDNAEGGGELTCTGSTFDAEFDSFGEPSVPGELTDLAYTGCTTTIPSCTVTSLTSVATIPAKIEYTGAEADGKMTIEQPETTAKLSCAFGLVKPECTYEGGEGMTVIADLYGPENEAKPSSSEAAIADITDQYALSQSDPTELCPESGTVSVTYSITADNGLSTDVYMGDVRTGTVLCEEEPKPAGQVVVCPKKTFSGKVEGEATAAATFKVSGTAEVVTCSKTPFSGDYKTNGLISANFSFKYEGTGAGNACTSTLGGKPDVAVALSTQNFPNSRFAWERVDIPQGSFWMTVSRTESKNLNLRMHLTIKAGGEPKCIYIPTGGSTKVTNGFGMNPTTMKRTMTLDFEKEEPPEKVPLCPKKQITHEANLKLNGVNGMAKPHIYLAAG